MSGLIEQMPAEVLDWTIDWTKRGLGSDTVQSSSWAASSPDFTLSAPSITPDGTMTTVFVTGGVPGRPYTVTNTVITVGNRTLIENVPYVCLAQRII